ncbi:DUF6151 family protein [Lutimaribacter marinistellae]|uniref:DUF6151 family protein n=1 Tax=Lutimaribacter marinistellae TaxID=1820329 RepID=A0ABV7TKL9_9RHOB
MSGGGPLRFSCTCGKVSGHMDEPALRGGFRISCHCPDCRAADRHLRGTSGRIDPIDIYQTSPDHVHIDSGADHLGLFRLGPKGLFRWYATCCGTPLFNTLASARLPFVGVLTENFETPDRLGPVRGQSFVPGPGGKPRNSGSGAMAWGIISRMLTARLSGRWRQTPFFDTESGKPRAEAQILSREQRAELYD